MDDGERTLDGLPARDDCSERSKPRLAAKVTDAVIAALDAQTVTLPAEATFGRVIAELAGELDRVHRRRAILAEEIEGVFLAHPF